LIPKELRSHLSDGALGFGVEVALAEVTEAGGRRSRRSSSGDGEGGEHGRSASSSRQPSRAGSPVAATRKVRVSRPSSSSDSPAEQSEDEQNTSMEMDNDPIDRRGGASRRASSLMTIDPSLIPKELRSHLSDGALGFGVEVALAEVTEAGGRRSRRSSSGDRTGSGQSDTGSSRGSSVSGGSCDVDLSSRQIRTAQAMKMQAYADTESADHSSSDSASTEKLPLLFSEGMRATASAIKSAIPKELQSHLSDGNRGFGTENALLLTEMVGTTRLRRASVNHVLREDQQTYSASVRSYASSSEAPSRADSPIQGNKAHHPRKSIHHGQTRKKSTESNHLSNLTAVLSKDLEQARKSAMPFMNDPQLLKGIQAVLGQLGQTIASDTYEEIVSDSDSEPVQESSSDFDDLAPDVVSSVVHKHLRHTMFATDSDGDSDELLDEDKALGGPRSTTKWASKIVIPDPNVARTLPPPGGTRLAVANRMRNRKILSPVQKESIPKELRSFLHDGAGRNAIVGVETLAAKRSPAKVVPETKAHPLSGRKRGRETDRSSSQSSSCASDDGGDESIVWNKPSRYKSTASEVRPITLTDEQIAEEQLRRRLTEDPRLRQNTGGAAQTLSRRRADGNEELAFLDYSQATTATSTAASTPLHDISESGSEAEASEIATEDRRSRSRRKLLESWPEYYRKMMKAIMVRQAEENDAREVGVPKRLLPIARDPDGLFNPVAPLSTPLSLRRLVLTHLLYKQVTHSLGLFTAATALASMRDTPCFANTDGDIDPQIRQLCLQAMDEPIVNHPFVASIKASIKTSDAFRIGNMITEALNVLASGCGGPGHIAASKEPISTQGNVTASAALNYVSACLDPRYPAWWSIAIPSHASFSGSIREASTIRKQCNELVHNPPIMVPSEPAETQLLRSTSPVQDAASPLVLTPDLGDDPADVFAAAGLPASAGGRRGTLLRRIAQTSHGPRVAPQVDPLTQLRERTLRWIDRLIMGHMAPLKYVPLSEAVSYTSPAVVEEMTTPTVGYETLRAIGGTSNHALGFCSCCKQVNADLDAVGPSQEDVVIAFRCLRICLQSPSGGQDKTSVSIIEWYDEFRSAFGDRFEEAETARQALSELASKLERAKAKYRKTMEDIDSASGSKKKTGAPPPKAASAANQAHKRAKEVAKSEYAALKERILQKSGLKSDLKQLQARDFDAEVEEEVKARFVTAWNDLMVLGLLRVSKNDNMVELRPL
jgi:hypothetical protein